MASWTRLLKIDWLLLSLVTALLSFGLIAVYSATHTGEGDFSSHFSKQMSAALLGLFLMLLTARVPFRFLSGLSWIAYALSILLLILVDLFGVRGFGAERWLALGPIKIQPSEFAKISTVMAVAQYLSQRGSDIKKWKSVAIAGAILFVPFALVIKQPDLGTALVFIAVSIPMLIWAGASWFFMFVLLSPAITMLISFKLVLFVLWISLILLLTIFSTRRTWLVVAMLLLHIGVGSVTPMAWNKLHPYQQKRITTFLNPEQDPRGSGYQIIQSQVAIGSGGFWGKGFMNGTQSQLKFLPAQHTDFIFSVVAEEWGLFGVTLALILFFGLILYLLDLATDVRSSFSSFALIGLTSILIFHVFINIAMTIGFAPVTGLPLPFFSYGRSFLISIMLMMGLVMNFSANQFEL